MGSISGTETYFPQVLQEVQLKERSSCPARISSKQICLKGSFKDSCGGDSGGPAYPLTGSGPRCLYGVVSYGSKKCTGWGVYSRVSAYAYWIDRNA
ncbi:kallikrein-13-like [Symsagittifera roscoffensis]|uniref:kallikrein-13-like n=1 Tax=Symsagittifera roscoffensis TaxID=84072 RepID=UPI00307B92C9